MADVPTIPQSRLHQCRNSLGLFAPIPAPLELHRCRNSRDFPLVQTKITDATKVYGCQKQVHGCQTKVHGCQTKSSWMPENHGCQKRCMGAHQLGWAGALRPRHGEAPSRGMQEGQCLDSQDERCLGPQKERCLGSGRAMSWLSERAMSGLSSRTLTWHSSRGISWF